MTSDQWARRAGRRRRRVGDQRRGLRGPRDLHPRRQGGSASLPHPRTRSASPPGPRKAQAGAAVTRWPAAPALSRRLEVGTCRLAGHLPALEDAAVLRQAGQHQPDRAGGGGGLLRRSSPRRHRADAHRDPESTPPAAPAKAGCHRPRVDAPPDRRLRRPSQRQRSFPTT